MSVERFIDALQERGLVSERVLGKLREKVAASPRPLSAKALAKFLVEKQHLTQGQATEMLASLSQADAEVATELTKDEATGTHMFSPAADDISTELATDTADDDDSSIFEAFLSPAEERHNLDDEPDIGLAPTSDDAPVEFKPSPKQAIPQMPSGVYEDSDALSSDIYEEPVAKKPSPRKAPKPADVPRLDNLLDTSSEEEFGEPAKPVHGGAKADLKLKRSKKKKPAKRTSQWDSPLILLGGGALALLVIGGVALAWLLGRESSDEKLKLAQDAVQSGSYTQAITHYEQFLERFPRDRNSGMARVKLVIVRLRKATEASNYSAALDIAQSELEDVDAEESFGETAHAELTALLPRIALGLAQEAEAAADPSAAKTLAEKATAALVLANNTKYVPSSLRDEGELEQVRLALERVERRQQSQQDLHETLAAMEQAIAAGDTRTSYARHIAIVKQHPELAGDPKLAEMVQKTTAAEKAAIRFVKDEKSAETTERPTPWIASLAVANRRVKPKTPAAALPQANQNPIACVRVSGAVYGFNAATGQVLWRRYVGYAASTIWPMPIDHDVVIADSLRHEMLRLDAATGKLRWRQQIGSPFAAPLIVGERGFVAAESGRLHVIDMTSGAQIGYVQFALPLRVTPAVDRDQQRLFLPGDHSSLYTLSLNDLACIGVYYLGHAEGSITVPLVPVMDKLAVVENDGVATSRMRLMSLNEDGAVSRQVVERRLNGLPHSAPFAADRRLIAVTDRGQIEVHEVATGDGEKSLTLVASRAATGKTPIIRHAALADKHVWVADTQLAKLSILPTGNRLVVESLESNFPGATFDHPLALFGQTLIHVRRPKGRAGAVVAATNMSDGRTLWETDLAVPPAGAPVIDATAKALTAANAAGHVFRFDEAAIRARVQDEPLPTSPRGGVPAKLPVLTTAVDLGRGRVVFCAAGADQLLLYNPALGDRAATWVQLDSPLACAVTPMGDGFVAPTQIGQVFYLSSDDGAKLAVPFQPVLPPNTTWEYSPAGVVDPSARQFVISDGRDKVYSVALVDQPQPHLKAVAEAKAGPHPISSAMLVLGDFAIAASNSTLMRFRLPSLETAGASNLPAPALWGPFKAGDAILLVTADEQMSAISAAGEVLWKVSVAEHGDLAGAPLVLPESIVIAYRKGIVERRSLTDGKLLGGVNVEHPLAAGPVTFLQRLVLTATDGTLLVVEQP